MPPPVSESPETTRYYFAQAALGASVASAIRDLWPELDPANLRGTFPTVRKGAAAVGSQHALAAVSIAADYYDDHREALGVTSPFRTPIIDAPTLTRIESEIDKAAAELLVAIDATVDDLYLAELATQIQAETEAAAQAAVADAGRDEILTAIQADREAKGWARVVRPGACSFCRMLAARGAVYLSKESGDFRAHRAINGRGGTCQCTVEPLLGQKYEPTAQARQDAAVWQQVTADGFRGADARNEFRRRLEGRTDGPRRLRGSDRKAAKPARVQSQRLGFDQLTPAQLRHQLDVLDKLPDSAYRASQMERVSRRLDFLAK